MFRRLISILLVILLMTSGVYATTFSRDDSTKKINSDELQNILDGANDILKMQRQQEGEMYRQQMGITEDMFNEDIFKEDMLNTYTQDEKVRIIVELKESPAKSVKEKEEKANQFKKSHDKVKKDIKGKGINGKFRHSYFMGLNGFSMETEYKNVKKIKSIPEVANVMIARVYDHAMASSKGMVNAQKVWEDLGLQGEGMVVAVVDSGVDYLHKDMKLTDEGIDNKKLTEGNLAEKLAKTEIDDIYYTEKVPTGYDWADNDNDVRPHGNSHGMHVSGTIGAYGDEENGGVIGIAPGVQILAEKVFSDYYGGAYDDDIVAGILHAVEMDADVINMSLGSPAGFVDEKWDPVQKAIRNATEQGVMVVVAGGNDYYSTKRTHPYPQSAYPFAENPDIGTIGSPGISPYALQVASYENDEFRVDSMMLSTGDELGYKKQPYAPDIKTLGEDTEYELVYVNEGSRDDLKDIDVEGKVVVAKVEANYYSYSYLQFNAKRAGAKAVIVRPYTGHGDYPVLYFSRYAIPAVTTSIEGGNELIEKLKNGEELKVTFNGEGLWIENDDKGEMSEFSSWGAPHNLDFKPEITAPGGDIYSTVYDNKYDVYSGTSMATPHVVGGSALVLQALKENGEEKGIYTVLMAKTMLMNTSKILYDQNIPYSPRRQGAGLMQIDKAIKTPALVYTRNESFEKAAAVALKEIKGNKAKFNLTIEALNGDLVPEDLYYDVYIDLLTDETKIKEYDNNFDGEIDKVVEVMTLNSTRVNGAKVKMNGKRISHDISSVISVGKGKKVELNFEIDLSEATNLNENMFVEGFVRLVPSSKNENSDIAELTVPYMGFYGEWDAPKNIDAPICEGEDHFLGYTVLWDQWGDLPLGYDPYTGKFDIEKIAMSPRGMMYGPYASFTAFRNLEEVEMYIEDENGDMINYISNFDEFTGEPWKFRKNIMAYQDWAYKMEYHIWEMKDEEGNIVPDGRYNFVIQSTLDYENAEPQTTKLPIKIDSIAPEIKNVAVNELEDGKYEITWVAADTEGGSGYKGAILWIDGKYVYPQPRIGETSFVVDEKPEGIVFMAYDYALNIRYQLYGNPVIPDSVLVSWWGVSGSKVNYENPARIYAFANQKLNWTITIKDPDGNEVDTIVFENKDAIYFNDCKWSPEKGQPDGEYSVIIKAIDDYGFSVTTQPKTFNVVNNQ